MHGRKRYWTEAFVATILISTIFGFVAGSKFEVGPNLDHATSTRKAFSGCSCFCVENTATLSSNPLIQPNALLINSCSGVPVSLNKVRKLLCEHGAVGRGVVAVHRTTSCTLDATPYAIMLPFIFVGLLVTLRWYFLKIGDLLGWRKK